MDTGKKNPVFNVTSSKQCLDHLIYSCLSWAIMYFSLSDELVIEGLFVATS